MDCCLMERGQLIITATITGQLIVGIKKSTVSILVPSTIKKWRYKLHVFEKWQKLMTQIEKQYSLRTRLKIKKTTEFFIFWFLKSAESKTSKWLKIFYVRVVRIILWWIAIPDSRTLFSVQTDFGHTFLLLDSKLK